MRTERPLAMASLDDAVMDAVRRKGEVSGNRQSTVARPENHQDRSQLTRELPRSTHVDCDSPEWVVNAYIL